MEPVVTDTPSDRPVRLARNRNFQLLWSTQFLSSVGTRTSRLCYPLLVLAALGSPAQASWVSMALTLPMPLFYLSAGAVVDRCGQKRILLVCEVARFVALGSVGAAVLLGTIALPHLMAAAFIEGTCFVFFQITEAALLPRVVPAEQLGPALAANQARGSTAELVGQPLGGFLFGLGWAIPFLVDAASYLVSFAALLGLRVPPRSAPERGSAGLRGDFTAGLRWFVGQRELLVLAAFIGLVNLLFTALPLVMIVRVQQGGGGPAATGWMFALLSVGAIAGALVAPRLSRRVNQRVWLWTSPWLWAGCIAALATTHRPLVLGGIVGAAMLTAPTFNVITSTYWYRSTPDELQGRSQSALRMITWGTLPLGSLTAGLLTTHVSTTASFTGLAAGMSLVALSLGWCVRSGRIRLSARPA